MAADIINSIETRGTVMTVKLAARTRLAFVSSMAAGLIAIYSPALAADPGRAVQLSPASACSVHSAGEHGRGTTAADRVNPLHDKLKITPDEEVLWGNVAQVMLDNDAAVDDAVQARIQKAGSMNAVDDLLSYQAIVVAHAEGLKKLAVAFAPLYAAMPEAQQRNADAVFGHRTTSRLKAHE